MANDTFSRRVSLFCNKYKKEGLQTTALSYGWGGGGTMPQEKLDF
jgi:hypothetical protein